MDLLFGQTDEDTYDDVLTHTCKKQDNNIVILQRRLLSVASQEF